MSFISMLLCCFCAHCMSCWFMVWSFIRRVL